MLHQVFQIFRRYVVEHLDLRKPGFPIQDENARQIGHVDTIAVSGNRLKVTGWCEADRVALITDTQRVDGVPDLYRPDVAASRGCDAHVGFNLDIPYFASRVTLVVELPGQRHFHTLTTFEESDLRRARHRMALPFLRDALRVLPAAIRWQLRRDPVDKATIKAGLRFGDPRATTSALVPEVFEPSVNAGRDAGGPEPSVVITIVMPVYNAFDLLAEVLDRVVRHTDLPWRMVIVEDCSTDDRVRPWLRSWVRACAGHRPDQVSLIENAANVGFIGSVNLALAQARTHGGPVVLLNSDAFVPMGWASRLVRPILDSPGVASVTPLSNDAEIFSVPVICRRSDLKPGDGDALDLLAQSFNKDTAQAQAPTGVGFCMALNPAYLKMEPSLDTSFGRGYGEEVDWCQKVRAKGGRHLGIATLFVEHRGGGSFGSAEKKRLVAANNDIISRRYPRYDQDVQDFIRQDPLATPRLALAIHLAARRQPEGIAMPVYLAHSLGGGAESYLTHRIASDLEQGGAAIVLRVGGPQRWQVELIEAGGRVTGVTQDFALVARMLVSVVRRRIVYSCGVGASDPSDLPGALLSLAAQGAHRIEVLFHDFFPISPSYTLLDSKGLYQGVPRPDARDAAHLSRTSEGLLVTLMDWQEAWGRLMRAADELVVFSQDSADKVAEVWPDVGPRIAVRPHQVLHQIPKLSVATTLGRKPVIGVLGNIGLQKGVSVLADISKDLARRGVADLVVIGNIDPAYRLAPPARVHGNYKLRDIPDLVARYGISCWLIPSIWPETFSYATHEVLATGLPVWCFDLGAQAEAVRAAVAEGAPGGVIALAEARASVEGLVDHILKQSVYESA